MIVIAGTVAFLLVMGGSIWLALWAGRKQKEAIVAWKDADNAQTANEAHGDIAHLPDGAAADKLRSDWQREPVRRP